MKPWEKYEHLILEASLDQNSKAFITRKFFIMIVYIKLSFYTYFTKNQQRNYSRSKILYKNNIKHPIMIYISEML